MSSKVINDVYFKALLKGFDEQFKGKKNKKIILYGIGAFSATVVEYFDDYNFIGLMDRDPKNVGKELYGLPIMDAKQAEKEGDLIIINTEASYWNTIFKRIKDISIPVYFRNGQTAELKDADNNYVNNEYWSQSSAKLINMIKDYDVISFDIFDTLLMRKVLLPNDIFEIVQRRIQCELNIDISFVENRLKALHIVEDRYADYEDIYNKFRLITGLSQEIIEQIKNIEISVEKEMLIPRYEMQKIFDMAKKCGKKVYLLSDMYLSPQIVEEILLENDINGYDSLWISSYCKMSKQDESMWKEFKNILGEKKALHIGDNKKDDIENAIKNGIDAFYIMNAKDILEQSSLNNIVPNICSLTDSIICGLICVKIFNNPFALSDTKGLVRFDRTKEVGYSIYGSVIFNFIIWLLKKASEEGIEQLLFFARDGYFLIKHFDYIKEKIKYDGKIEGKYFMISRRLVAVASIDSDEDFDEVSSLPYSGTFEEYMDARFDISLDKSDNNSKQNVNPSSHNGELVKFVTPYRKIIDEEIKEEKKNYINYCKNQINSNKFGIVDTWYYGNCQYYLSKLLKCSTKGFYFCANLSSDNRCTRENQLFACYQEKDDLKAAKSKLVRYSLQFESVFTAPYGMVKKCLKDGTFKCEEKGKNQEYFNIKEEINDGITMFIDDIVPIMKKIGIFDVNLSTNFIDNLFGCFFDNGCKLSDEIKKTYYNENKMQNNSEYTIFE